MYETEASVCVKTGLHLHCELLAADTPRRIPPQLLAMLNHVAKPSDAGCGSSGGGFLEVSASVQGGCVAEGLQALETDKHLGSVLSGLRVQGQHTPSLEQLLPPCWWIDAGLPVTCPPHSPHPSSMARNTAFKRLLLR